jgi:hypothetical protein
MERMTVLAPLGMLGYGIPARSMEEGLARNPDALTWARVCPSRTGAR